MPESFTREELQLIAAQLRHPHGEHAQTVAQSMQESNKTQVCRMYDRLPLKNGASVLEIGMANAPHLAQLFKGYNNLRYLGFDYSSEMVEAAKSMNEKGFGDTTIDFQLGDLDALNFDPNSFDAICSSNTLYFWPNPAVNVKNLFTVLKPGGFLLLAFRTKAVMDEMPVTEFGFQKYWPQEAKKLMQNAGFVNISDEVLIEPDREVMGKNLKIDSCYLLGQKI